MKPQRPLRESPSQKLTRTVGIVTFKFGWTVSWPGIWHYADKRTSRWRQKRCSQNDPLQILQRKVMLNMTAHGNLGRDPELKEVGSSQVASFSIAARTGKDQTTWIDCSVWGKRAETVMSYLHKGDRVTVVGSGRIRTFDKKDGSEGKSLELNVSDFTLPAKSTADF